MDSFPLSVVQERESPPEKTRHLMNKTRPDEASRALQLESLDSESADMGGPVCEGAGRHYWPLERGANLAPSIKDISFPFFWRGRGSFSMWRCLAARQAAAATSRRGDTKFINSLQPSAEKTRVVWRIVHLIALACHFLTANSDYW